MEPLRETSLADFKMGKLIGKGSFGEIYRVNDAKDDKK